MAQKSAIFSVSSVSLWFETLVILVRGGRVAMNSTGAFSAQLRDGKTAHFGVPSVDFRKTVLNHRDTETTTATAIGGDAISRETEPF